MSASSKHQKRRRGRPARLSRERVLQAGLELLSSGNTELTISAVARALNCTPMSLYTHVDNRDDLINGVSDLILSQVNFDIDVKDPWLRQTELWIIQLHRQIKHYPQVVLLLGQSTNLPPSWLSLHAVLFRILIKGGFEGEQLVNTGRWIAQAIIGDITLNQQGFEAIEAENEHEHVLKAMQALDEEDQQFYSELLLNLSPEPINPFDFMVEQLLRTLADAAITHAQ